MSTPVFAPKPPNDFNAFIETYFDRCRALSPKIRVIAGKWRFDDLIPGLSDFDTRFVVSDDTTVADWSEMSLAVGEVHSKLAQERPHWARNLEHLPGVNVTISELTDPLFYYPEFPQWTYYHGDAAVLTRISDYLAAKPWTARDELFHLKRFATYYGPYIRGIDPAVNMGKWESKYPLHSRYMHYFTPPVQAAVSLMRKRGVRGKLEALTAARDIFPNPSVIDRVFDALAKHYEIPGDYADDALARIESQLDAYLRDVYAALEGHLTLFKVDAADTPAKLRERVNALPVDPVETFFDGVKFARFMKGRLLFYAQDIPWFDSIWLIRNELGRIVSGFFEKPLSAYGLARWQTKMPARDVLAKVRGEIVADADAAGILRFVDLASKPLEPGREKRAARDIAEIYDAVPRVHAAIAKDLLARLRSNMA